MVSHYLIGTSHEAATEWLGQQGFTEICDDNVDMLIETFYPGGVHFFLAEHMTNDCAGESRPTERKRLPPQPALLRRIDGLS